MYKDIVIGIDVARKSKKRYQNRRIQTRTHSSRIAVDKKHIYAVLEVVSIICVYICVLAFVCSALFILLIYLQRAQYFSIQHIDIKGNKRLSTNRILALSGINIGDNILRVRLGSIYERLYESKWIKRVAVRKTFPDTIHIDIEELQASFWVQYDNALYYADALGFPITPVDKAFFVSLPVLEIEKGAEDFVIHLPAIIQELQKMPYPLDVKSISWIKLTTTATVQFFIESMNFTVTLSIADWSKNLKKVVLVLHDMARKNQLSSVRKIYANGVVLVEM